VVNELLAGYARVSTEQQDLSAQRSGLYALGVGDDRVYVDHGLLAHTETDLGFGLLSQRVPQVTPWL
jgi:hypothetical protein